MPERDVPDRDPSSGAARRRWPASARRQVAVLGALVLLLSFTSLRRIGNGRPPIEVRGAAGRMLFQAIDVEDRWRLGAVERVWRLDRRRVHVTIDRTAHEVTGPLDEHPLELDALGGTGRTTLATDDLVRLVRDADGVVTAEPPFDPATLALDDTRTGTRWRSLLLLLTAGALQFAIVAALLDRAILGLDHLRRRLLPPPTTAPAANTAATFSSASPPTAAPSADTNRPIIDQPQTEQPANKTPPTPRRATSPLATLHLSSKCGAAARAPRRGEAAPDLSEVQPTRAGTKRRPNTVERPRRALCWWPESEIRRAIGATASSLARRRDAGISKRYVESRQRSQRRSGPPECLRISDSGH